MTSIVDKNFLKDKETSSFIEGLVKLTSDNKEFINIENKYKIDNTLGSFYCEYNSKFNEALLANN
jgi:hypothetical protein